MLPSGRNLVDLVHNVTFCWMSKSGCTALKAFMLEANGMNIGDDDHTDSLNVVHFVETYNKYGLKQMYQLQIDHRRRLAASYSNIMAIRHPFDRLVAYYRDKMVDTTDRASNHPDRAADILREMRPKLFERNETLSGLKYPQDLLGPPTFSELLTWIKRHRVMDEHWNLITDVCHPCAHDWGAILRVETMTTDGNLFAKMINYTHPIPVRHSHQTELNLSQFGKTLQLFADVDDDVIEYLLNLYAIDMSMFGYKWHRGSHTAYCAIDTENGLCC